MIEMVARFLEWVRARAVAAPLTPPPPGSVKPVGDSIFWMAADGSVHLVDDAKQPLRPMAIAFCLVCREEHGCRVRRIDDARILVTCLRPPTARATPPIPGAEPAPPPEGPPA